MVGMVVVALFLQAGILMYVNSKNADKTSQMLLDQAISIIEKNQENEKDLLKSMKEDYIVRARAVAYILESSLSSWLKHLSADDQIVPEDKDEYLAKTDLDSIRRRFDENKAAQTITYHCSQNGKTRTVTREIVPTDEYTPENRTGFLYIKENEKAHGFFLLPRSFGNPPEAPGQYVFGNFCSLSPTLPRKCLKSFHFLLTNDVFCDSVSEEQKTKSKIQLLFSYSEWWRYIGSVKPRQPPDRMLCTGRCQPERNFRTIRGFEHCYSGPLRLRIFFIVQRSYRRSKEKRRKRRTRMEKRLFTSESVTEGHPDKLCDAVSDAILDALLEQDPMSRVACETCTTTGYVMVMGEITSKAQIDIQQIVRDTVREIGYDRAKYGFDADTCAVIVALDKQSTDIAMGVDKALEAKENNMSDEEIDAIGAGDQGMMFGFASNETDEYMPYPIYLAHKLARQLTKVRKDGTLSYLRPDGKTQVTVEYDENGKPFRLDAVVLSTQHDPEVSQEQIHEDIKKYVFDEIIPADMVDEHTKFFINPTGRFVIGGPHGDSGLTGRKIIVDTYGGYARHGGGAFSGKDCTKVDRSAAYAARYVAKNIVAAGLADKCEVQLSYAIGVAHPTSIMIDSYGTGKLSDNKLTDIVRENFDLRPAGIIKMLDLRRPIYKQTSAYGHFGRNDLDLPWEKLDKVEDLKKYL